MNLKADGNGDFEAAIDYIRNGIRQIPLNFSLLYNFGVVNEKLGNYNIALKFFRFAQTVNPKSADALYGEAVVSFKMGKYRDSLLATKKAIELTPEDDEDEECCSIVDSRADGIGLDENRIFMEKKRLLEYF